MGDGLHGMQVGIYSPAGHSSGIHFPLAKVSPMRKVMRTSLVMLGSAALIGGMALPASAETVDAVDGAATASNIATVEIVGGALTLDTTTDGFTLTHSGAATGVSTATGTLTGVNVSDLNSDGTGWTSTAVLSTLTGTLPEDVIDASGATYESLVTTFSEGAVVDGNGATVTAADGGNNTAVWATTVTLNIPNTVKADSYTGTLTHSLS